MPGFPSPPSPPVASGPNALGSSQVNPDELSQLQEVSWRGIPFPCVFFSESGAQQLSIHRYPNQDSARVEPTGRMPSRFMCRAILTNNIFPGTKESWKQGLLYPDTFDKLLNQLYTDDAQQPGTLVHPSLGNVTARVVKWKYDYIGHGPRDGVYLDIEFIETIGNVPLTVSNTSGSQSYNFPSSLDNPPLSPPNLSLGQFMQALNQTIKQIASYPSNSLDAIQSQLSIINGAAQGIAASLITAIPQTIAAGQDFIALNKSAILNGPVVNSYNALDPGSVFGSSATVSNGQQQTTIAGSTTPSNPDTLNSLYQSAFAVNNAASGNGKQFLQRTQSFLQNSIAYYRSLNNVAVSDTIVQLSVALNNVQALQSNLFGSANTSGYQLETYTTQTNITWQSLAKILNQDLDTLMALNQAAAQTYFVPANTVIYYQQG